MLQTEIIHKISVKMKNCIILFSLATSVLSAQQIPSVNVMGEKAFFVEPNIIQIGISIENEGSDLTQVKQNNDETAGRVLAILKKKLPPTQYQTQQINIRKYRDYDTKDSKYIATQSFGIKLENVSEYEPLMEALFLAGINRIEYVHFDLKEEDKTRLLKQARAEAINNARQKALFYAQKLNQNIGKAIEISEVNATPSVRYRDDALGEISLKSNQNGTTIALGLICVEAKINVSFELLSK